MNQKVTQKLNRNVLKALQLATPKATDFKGFDKFSYTLEWHNFPGSLIISCHFLSNADLQAFLQNNQAVQLTKVIQRSFLKSGIVFKSIKHNVLFVAS